MICPHCRVSVDAAVNLTAPRPPRPGDVAVCFYCGGLTMYQSVMGVLALALLPAHLAVEMEADPQIGEMREEIRRRSGGMHP